MLLQVCCAVLASAEPEAKAETDPPLLFAGYAYGASPYAYYRKRSAEPEDKTETDQPLLFAGYAYGAYPSAYGDSPYAGYAGYAGASPYAEPENKAEADQPLLYTGFSYGAYPYAHYRKRSADANFGLLWPIGIKYYGAYGAYAYGSRYPIPVDPSVYAYPYAHGSADAEPMDDGYSAPYANGANGSF